MEYNLLLKQAWPEDTVGIITKKLIPFFTHFWTCTVQCIPIVSPFTSAINHYYVVSLMISKYNAKLQIEKSLQNPSVTLR